jgi:hypothetical protein
MVIHVFIKFWYHAKGMPTDTSWLTGCYYALENMQWRILYLTDLLVKEVLAILTAALWGGLSLCVLDRFVFVIPTIGNSLTLNFASYMHLLSLSSFPPSHFGHFLTIRFLIFVLSRIVSFPSFHPASRIHVFILTRWFPPLFMILHPFLSPYHFLCERYSYCRTCVNICPLEAC